MENGLAESIAKVVEIIRLGSPRAEFENSGFKVRAYKVAHLTRVDIEPIIEEDLEP